jgi:hypothetical protein
VRGNTSSLVVSALLGVALVAVAVVALRPNPELSAAPVEEPKPVVAAPVPVPAPAPEPPKEPEPPALPARVKVEVQSVPPGADVRIDDRAVGKTPVQVEMDSDTQPHKLIVKKQGLDAVDQDLVPDHDQTVTLQLAKRKLRAPRH